jgi:leucyl-tRNA synthetase
MVSSKQQDKEYKPQEIEPRWQTKWENDKTFSPDLANSKNPFYNLMMFPYPSAEGLHVGNMYAFTGADVYGRYQRMKGHDVFEPIGLDGFGIHSENYALKVGRHPLEQAKLSEKNFYRQLRATGNAYDWTRTVETYDPEYYRWTQWIFVQMFKKGLAYRKKAKVNWCPSCKTVLADEQVIEGRCERCNSTVEKRDLEQWFFKITDYADRLLNGLNHIDWPEKIKIAQRQWIGKSDGTIIKFPLVNVPGQADKKHTVEVFTTRADTLFGATFLVIAPELASFWLSVGWKAPQQVKKYIAKAISQRGKISEEKEKTGVFAEIYAINPVNKEKIPVWIADYAVMDYGTGALFGDAHDERDTEFAKNYNIALKPTLLTGDKKRDEKIKSLEECFTGYGTLFDSGEFSGLASEEAKKAITTWLEKNDAGGRQTTYHLRDWLISRQRYWGPPIPMIFCSNCAQKGEGERENMPGWYAVGEENLPVLLPDVEDWRPQGSGASPLANHPEFYETKCPSCGSKAKRETDVSDTFLDSAWYYLKYVSVDNNKMPYDINIVKKWCPVDMYIGGAEHSVLHLLYVRFIAMVLHDLKTQLQLPFEEPFPRFFAHGLIIKDRAKMSKSRGNIVVPDQYIQKYGADSMRMYLMFIGPFEEGGDFRDTGIEGMYKFVRRVWTLLGEIKIGGEEEDTKRAINKLIKDVTQDIENLSYNTAIAHFMEFYNFIKGKKQISKETLLSYIKLMAPFAPHMTEEISHGLGLISESIHTSSWPTFDEKYLIEDKITVVIQVNGKRRAELSVDRSEISNQRKVESIALEAVKKYLEGNGVKKTIYVPGKIVNFVV